ncbi:hypothetical protein SESBI_50928 [Sesbania bispinosa]|nr:hypothetical protein SESBI_50928 [Sesbania bispinosa]
MADLNKIFGPKPNNSQSSTSSSMKQKPAVRLITMKDVCYYTQPTKGPSSTSSTGTPLPTLQKCFTRRSTGSG